MSNRTDEAFRVRLQDVSLAGTIPLGASPETPSLFRSNAARLWPLPWDCNGCTIALDGYLVWQGKLLVGNSHEDAEQLGQALTSDPLRLVRSLDNGAFVIVIHDHQKRCTQILTDRMGLVALYMLRTADEIAFASDLVGIQLLARSQPPLDEVGLAELYWFGYQIGQRTCYQGVELAPAGALLTVSWQDGSIQTLRWDRAKRAESLGAHELAELPRRIVDVMTTACDRLHHGPLRYALKLSGGMDSRLIAGCWRHPLFCAYTWGDPESAELHIGQRLARQLGLRHRSVPIEGSFLSNQYARMHERFGIMDGTTQFGVSVIREDNVDVCLDGLGGDFMLGGLFQKGGSWLDTMAGAFNAHLPDRALLQSSDQIADYVFGQVRVADSSLPILDSAHRQRLANAIPAILRDLRGEIDLYRTDDDTLGSLVSKVKQANRTRRYISLDGAVARPRIATVHPFLDRGLQDLAIRLPSEITANKRLYIRVYREALPHIRAVPPIMSCLPFYLPHSIHYAGRVARKLREEVGYWLLQRSRGTIALRGMEATQWPKWLIVNRALRESVAGFLTASDAVDPVALGRVLGGLASGKTLVPGNRLMHTISYCLHFRPAAAAPA